MKYNWVQITQNLKIGTFITGKVTRIEHYGFYVDLGIPFEGLVQITDITDKPGKLNAEDWPKISDQVTAVVLGFKANNHQIWLGTKQSQVTVTK